jgi:hypothetical protein
VFYQPDASLAQQMQTILEQTWMEFPWLARNQLALTWLIYDPPFPVNTGGALSPEGFWKCPVRGCSYRGVEQIYPASVVKLFYLVACHEWIEKGMLPPSEEVNRALHDMIADSSNDATGYIVDMLTGTTSGPELPPGPFETWKAQRNIINRYFQSLGWPELESINVNQKTWGDGPYGRENDFVGKHRENRNCLSTDAVARLLHGIVGGVAVSASRSRAMMQSLHRNLDPAVLAEDPENQVTGFIGAGVPLSSQVWSKAGWTSTVRHDAAYVEIPGKHPYLLVVFTDSPQASRSEAVIPFISTKVSEAVPSCESDHSGIA